MERLMKVLCVLVVAVCVAPAMATYAVPATYDAGFAGGWVGPASGGDFGSAANWAGGENTFLTGYWDMNGSPNDASISAGTDLIGGYIRVKNTPAITQTGGSVEFYNGAAVPVAIGIFGGSGNVGWSISGGELICDGPLGLGSDNYANNKGSSNYLNISGDGVVYVRNNPDDGVDGFNVPDAALLLYNSSTITISDLGQLWVQSTLQSVVDNYITAGRIVGSGGNLQTATVGDKYVVSVVPEPATMALLGLGALVLRRKK